MTQDLVASSELPQGYRMTEIGPLPEEWQVLLRRAGKRRMPQSQGRKSHGLG